MTKQTFDQMFNHLVNAPVTILGKPMTLLHWSGVTHKDTLFDIDEAKAALEGGWSWYRVEEPQ